MEKEKVTQTLTTWLNQVLAYPERLAALGKVLFNLHINVVDRFVLGDPPGCIERWPACTYKHFHRAPIGEVQRDKLNILEASLDNESYPTFLVDINNFIQRCEWPTESILNKIIEHILKINPGGILTQEYTDMHIELCGVFSEIVEQFPPCWLTYRPSYYNLFKSPIAAFSPNFTPLTRKAALIDDWLELLDATLLMADDQTPDGHNSDDGSSDEDAPRYIPFKKGTTFEKMLLGTQSFGAMKRGRRLERLFLILQLILNILERDLSTWIQYTSTAQEPVKFLFHNEHKPLVVAAFGLTATRPHTATVRKTFELFARAFHTDVNHYQLQLLERLISLVMLAVNMYDIKTLEPQLGSNARNLIIDFFDIFKRKHGSDVRNYDAVSQLLRIPSVRYEFIHNVLKLSKFSPKGAFSPSKVVDELLVKQRWLKLKPQVGVAVRDDVLSRELYLKMLLVALKDYCSFYGLKPFYDCLRHGWITNGFGQCECENYERVSGADGDVAFVSNGARFRKMRIVHLTKETLQKYGEDIHLISTLHKKLPEKFPDHIESHFKDWMVFLRGFLIF